MKEELTLMSVIRLLSFFHYWGSGTRWKIVAEMGILIKKFPLPQIYT